MSALDVQVSGNHYKKCPYQPVELIVNIGATFLEGNIIKYTTRFKDKAGLDDLRKVKHYFQFIRELVYKNGKAQRPEAGIHMAIPSDVDRELYKYKQMNDLSILQYNVIRYCICAKYEGGLKDITLAEFALDRLAETEYRAIL